MPLPTWESLFTLIQSGGTLALLTLIIWSGARKIWRYGHEYDEMKAELEKQLAQSEARSDQWRDLALSGTAIAERLSAMHSEKRRLP